MQKENVEPLIDSNPSLRTKFSIVALATLLGTMIGFMPSTALIVGDNIFSRPAPWGIGLAVYLLRVVFIPLGAFTGLIAGFLYLKKEHFFMSSAFCIGINIGGIMAGYYYAIHEEFDFLIWLAPTAGGLIGILFTIYYWRELKKTAKTKEVEKTSMTNRSNEKEHQIFEKERKFFRVLGIVFYVGAITIPLPLGNFFLLKYNHVHLVGGLSTMMAVLLVLQTIGNWFFSFALEETRRERAIFGSAIITIINAFVLIFLSNCGFLFSTA